MSGEKESLVPSFVVFQIGNRRVAVPRDCVAELIASPVLFSFPHTTPLITGVALRRGRIVPILDLGPGLLGAPSPEARFYLVVERRNPSISERCAIPVQGECELVSGIMLPASAQNDFVVGCIDLNGEQIDVLDLEKAIATSARIEDDSIQTVEALP
ncbi:MAG TPA: chemotaxis protein CheW [Candidatus Sulfotelmatobacter sp.]|jgi:chemotaxis signal transduction protein|nr:chemotaxis protein CheW [Candidatus Sulfotelmatobacter sp.]